MSRASPFRPARVAPLLALLILSLPVLLLAACGQQPAPDVHTGTDGLVLELLPSLPDQVIEETTLPVLVRIHNRGAYPLNYSWIITQLRGDTFYVDVDQESPLARAKLVDTDTLLYGKGSEFPNGESLILQPNVTFKKVQGLREEPEVELYASVCYPYETRLGTTLCVDSNKWSQNQQPQICTAESVTFRSQGAPVAVTLIENRPTPTRVAAGTGVADVVQPVFIVHVENVGTGTVLRGDATEEELVTACALRTPAEEAAMVSISAELSGIPLACEPALIPLRDDAGFTTCVLPAEDLAAIQAFNYQGVFTARLGYVYRDSVSGYVSIERRSPIVSGRDALGDPEENPGLVHGQPRCEYCSLNPDARECEGWPDEAVAGLFSCACSESECQKRYRDGECVYGQTWCPGTNYCCIPG